MSVHNDSDRSSGGKSPQPARQVLGSLPLNQELPTQSVTLDCSKAVLRMPAYVAAKLEAEKYERKMLTPLTFTMIQQRIRDHFVRDLDDDEAGPAEQRYVLTSRFFSGRTRRQCVCSARSGAALATHHGDLATRSLQCSRGASTRYFKGRS